MNVVPVAWKFNVKGTDENAWAEADFLDSFLYCKRFWICGKGWKGSKKIEVFGFDQISSYRYQ